MVPPSRIRPYIERSSPSMFMVALSAREATGEMNVLYKMIRAKTKRNPENDGSRKLTITATRMPRPMIRLCQCFESASPVQNGAATSVTRGGIPVNKPICAPLKERA
jgi:hypothetical protein